MHGQLPRIPECDLLLIAGDICPVMNHDIDYQACWLNGNFRRWLWAQPAKEIVGVAGNHDMIFEKEKVRALLWTYLCDAMTEKFGLRIFGLPWQKRFHDWAFNLDPPDLALKYEAIPECDIIVSHGPPYGYGDIAYGEHHGCPEFTRRIDEIQPKLVVYGHIHCNPGVWTRGKTTLANVSVLDDNYRMVREPMVFEL
jgi:hypothetical protein